MADPKDVAEDVFMEEGESGEVRQNAEYDASMPLSDREAKWGFTLSELQCAVKVVQVLFKNPQLYVGDPYLSDSRLYTMITRDRKTKREHREVYKLIMNEEKSRRKRYQRLQDMEAVRKTAMKREREEALNVLMLADGGEASKPPLLLCDKLDTAAPASTVREEEGNKEASMTDAEKAVLQLIGAFESILRLEQAYAKLEVEGLPNVSLANGKTTLDWVVVTQLTAQVYRYIPHLFGSQMPPPLLPGAVPLEAAHDPAKARNYLIGLKCLIAQKAAAVAQLPPVPPSDRMGKGLASQLLSTSRDVVVRTELKGLHRIDGLRALVAGEKESIEGAVPQVEEAVDDVLRSMELVLMEGSSAALAEPRFQPVEGSANFGPYEVAMQSLHLFIARRLYQSSRIRNYGLSPVVVDYVPPTSTSEEPDTYCAYDDVQQYAGDHHAEEDALKLNKWIGCHTCKVRYNCLHPYYYSLCHLCGEFNYNKRLMARDLRGKVVLLTGCRIKIGYAMALSLLRCGATVLGTTRFAHEAVARFQQEADYEVWKDRLHLFSLDLRDMWVVTQFCAFVGQTYPKLFAIINNAAQTIARTPAYTEHLRRIELSPPLQLRQAIAADSKADEWHNFFCHHTTVTVGQALSIEHHPTQQPFLSLDGEGEAAGTEASTRRRVDSPPHDEETEASLPGTVVTQDRTLVFDRYDTQAEESDHREQNSWVMNLAEVQGSEAAEVMAINALSPFILNGKLKPYLMNRGGDDDPNEPRFIINVSAMEGQFYRFKQTTHPHTNMAKAALNMMTRTSGEDYAKDGIYMNSVDTGWITDESPKMKKERRAEQFMLCPLDEVDAAARCLDLIYTDSKAYGKFYKDFKEIAW